MTDSTTYAWPTPTGLDNSGNYVTTIGTGNTFTPYTATTTWTSDYAEKKNLEAWMRILVERIEKLQDKIKELEGKIDGR